MSWLSKKAINDSLRVERNLSRLEDLRSRIHDLGYYVVSSNSGGFSYLKEVLDESIVVGRPHIKEKLLEALIGENNQKIALDAPLKFQNLMREAEVLIDREIAKEKRKLKELKSGKE